MATVKQTIADLDYVELLDPVGKWPAGTRGTVVDESGEWRQLEISDRSGQALELISVHETGLKLLARHAR